MTSLAAEHIQDSLPNESPQQDCVVTVVASSGPDVGDGDGTLVIMVFWVNPGLVISQLLYQE